MIHLGQPQNKIPFYEEGNWEEVHFSGRHNDLPYWREHYDIAKQSARFNQTYDARHPGWVTHYWNIPYRKHEVTQNAILHVVNGLMALGQRIPLDLTGYDKDTKVSVSHCDDGYIFDHIHPLFGRDNRSANNGIENLRLATKKQNSHNDQLSRITRQCRAPFTSLSSKGLYDLKVDGSIVYRTDDEEESVFMAGLVYYLKFGPFVAERVFVRSFSSIRSAILGGQARRLFHPVSEKGETHRKAWRKIHNLFEVLDDPPFDHRFDINSTIKDQWKDLGYDPELTVEGKYEWTPRSGLIVPDHILREKAKTKAVSDRANKRKAKLAYDNLSPADREAMERQAYYKAFPERQHETL